MTVAAGMMAFSCATDTTDDLGVNLGKGQKTVISVSLEESRTQLGGYDEANEKYPMYWSAGDKISVNGVESEEAVISTGNAAVASFAVNGLGEPDHYFVAYPAVEGDWQVKFAAEQNNLSGEKNTTFDEGVSTMYGYSEEGLNVQMNHLTGILKIGIVLPEGSAAKELIKAQISTVDRKPIAGTFDFAFETDAEGNKVPKLTPTADAVSVIEYIFGKGKYAEGEWQGSSTPLSTNRNYPTYIHVAVPAGIYDELYVTLHDTNGGVMYATVKADDTKPLAAGTVREFKKNDAEQFIEYAPTANDVTVIKNYDDLVKFNKAAASATKVVLANDITILDGTNDTAWTSIENFAGEFYGNGYAIKGLTAPLFGTTSATIKGVHLEDVDITATTPMFGALVCNYTGTSLSHCSVEGDIEVNSTFTHLGGIIGRIDIENTVYDLHNKANITLLKTEAAIELDAVPSFGGCIGGFADNVKGSMYNCSNAGDITIYSDIKIPTGGYKTLRMGGVVGFGEYLSIFNCQNSGNIDIYGKLEMARLAMGGISGDARNGDLEGITNSGNITFKENSELYTHYDFSSYIGGLAGFYVGVKSCKSGLNKGCINIEKGATFKLDGDSLLIGGCIGNGYSKTCNDAENSGAITFSGTVESGTLDIGGVLGCVGTVDGGTGITNATGDKGFVNNGTITLTVDAEVTNLNIGGCVGYMSKTNIYNLTNNEQGTVTVESGANATGTVRIGGVFGHAINQVTAYNIENKADIVINSGATIADGYAVGGLVGEVARAINGAINSGNIHVGIGGNGHVAGGVAKVGSIHTKMNWQILCDVDAVGVTNVGMVFAMSYDDLVASNYLKAFSLAHSGGKIATTLGEDGKSFYRTITKDPVIIDIEEDYISTPDPNYVPYYEVIYSAPVEAALAKSQSCGYISAIGATPEYAVE